MNQLSNFSNYFFNPHAIPVLVVGSLILFAGIVLFIANRKAPTTFSFFLICLSVSIWLLATGMGYLCESEKTAMLWFKFDNFGVAFISISVYFFTRSFINLKGKKFIAIGYIIALVFGILIIKTNYLVTGVRKYFWGYFPSWGRLGYPFLTFFFGYMLASFFTLFFQLQKTKSPIKRNQIKYVMLAYLIGYTGSIDYLATYGIEVYPFGYISLFLFLSIIGYTIVTYRLMDITFVIRDTTLRLISSLFPAIVFLTIGSLFFSFPVMVAMIILTAITSPFLYGPLRRLFQPVLLGARYDYQRLLKESTKSLVTILDLRQLLDYTVNTISDTVGVEKISFFLKEGNRSRYEIKASCGLEEELLDKYALKPNEGIISWLKQSKTVFIKEEMERTLPGKAFENIYGGLEKIGAELTLPLFYKDNLVGLLTLSQKQSGDIYNQTDIDILESLGAQAAVAIENARLHTEVITDELTELYQPRYFELRLREEIEKAKRYKHCLSLMMIGIDNFEEFRKKYKQEEEDKLLKSMAGIIRENLRMGDIACRCEEKGFGIILPEITEEFGVNIRERLKKQIKETVEIGERLRRRVGEKELGITLSIGIANFDGQDREMKREIMIKQARDALTQAKREGNTVKVFYDEKLRQEISSEVLEWVKETEETLVSGNIYVDLSKRSVQVNGKPVKLTPKAFDLLCLLMKKKGRVLNRSFLTESVWGYEYFGTTRTVDSHIKSLRQMLGAEGKKIETVKGVGYKFVDEDSII